jgi:DNA-binding response OmpR family regulator
MHIDHTIVVIDSYEPIRVSIAYLLEEAGYSVTLLAQQATADALATLQPALVILEVQRSCADAIIMLLDQLRQRDATHTVPIIVTTTDRRLLLHDLAEPLTYLRCIGLVKPFDVDQLLACVARALSDHAGHQTNGRHYGMPMPLRLRSTGE